MAKSEKIKHMTTEDPAAKALAKTLPQRPAVEPKRGPQIAEMSLSDKDVVNLHATAEDFSTFRRSLSASQTAKAQSGWRKLPGGSSVRSSTILAGCPGCGIWVWVEPRHVKSPCARCNFMGRSELAILRPATTIEIADWFIREQKRVDDFKATKPQRDADVASFNKRKFQDMR